MGVSKSFLFLVFISCVFAKEYVPVLIWDTNPSPIGSHEQISALSKLDMDEFADYFMRRVAVHKPLVAVFTEENLSVEDYSWRDEDDKGSYPSLTQITKASKGVEFIPSVHAPYKALRKLRKHGYSWELYNKDISVTMTDEEAIVLLVKLDGPETTEDRPDMLRRHDKQIAKIYKNLLKIRSHVVAVYTGHHSSWADSVSDRNKRETDNATTGAEPKNDDKPREERTGLFPAKNAMLYTASPMVLTVNDKKYNISTPTFVSSDTRENLLKMTVQFLINGEKQNLVFNFTSMSSQWFLKEVVYDNKHSLFPSMPIMANKGASYHCTETAYFKGANNNTNVVLAIKKFQIQPFLGNATRFSRSEDCVPYFTAPIWSAIFVIFILALITSWGILMIMDINTMDRFDDPKGKTITISALE